MTMVMTCTDPARPTTATATSRRREDEDGSSRRLRECCMWMCRDQDSTRACRSSHVDVRASASQRKPAQASASQRKPAQAGASRRKPAQSLLPTHTLRSGSRSAGPASAFVRCMPPCGRAVHGANKATDGVSATRAGGGGKETAIRTNGMQDGSTWWIGRDSTGIHIR